LRQKRGSCVRRDHIREGVLICPVRVFDQAPLDRRASGRRPASHRVARAIGWTGLILLAIAFGSYLTSYATDPCRGESSAACLDSAQSGFLTLLALASLPALALSPLFSGIAALIPPSRRLGIAGLIGFALVLVVLGPIWDRLYR